MSRLLSRWADQYPTITLLLSKPETTAGEDWIGWIPFNSLYFDDRPGVPALVGAVLDVAFGEEDGPLAGVRVSYACGTGVDPISSRKTVRPGIALRVDIDEGTPAFTDIPLAIYCLPLATDAVADSEAALPTPDTNSSVWTVKDVDGGVVGAKWEAVVPGGAGSVITGFDVVGDEGDSLQVVDSTILNILGDTGGFLFTGDGVGPSLYLTMKLASTYPGLELFEDGYGVWRWRVKPAVGKASIVAVFNGRGEDIVAGSEFWVRVPFACTILEGTLLNDAAGSIQIDVWKDVYANHPPTNADSITASAPLATSSAVKYLDQTLTGWTKTIAEGDVILFHVDSCTGVEMCTVQLQVQRG